MINLPEQKQSKFVMLYHDTVFAEIVRCHTEPQDYY